MDHDHQSYENRNSNPKFNGILIGFALVAGYFLVMEHKAHLGGLLNYLPYLLLLACPLMHLLMHHGHGGHGRRPAHKDDQGEQK
jgi:hypothetical protein